MDGKMGTCNAFIILLFLLTSSGAQQPSPSLFTVEGTVINAATGRHFPERWFAFQAELCLPEAKASFPLTPFSRARLSRSRRKNLATLLPDRTPASSTS